VDAEIVNKTQLKILDLIEAHSGRYSWYQLDRCLSESGTEHTGQLMPLLRELIAFGLIESSPEPNPAQPVYSITDAGVSAIRKAGRRDA
jgi:DNA-binding PadR family transcriptional regulator